METPGARFLRHGTVAIVALTLVVAACGSPAVSSGSPVASPSPVVSASPAEATPPPPSATPDAGIEPLACPDGLAVDGAGTLFVADVCSNRVMAYSASEELRLFAGTGTPGYSGDGGAAEAAELEYVGSVTVDSAGDVHIVECGGNVIRRVDADGIISTVAGTGGRGAGNGGYSGDGGPATEAELACPSDAIFDASGNLYIVDRENSVVRRVDRTGVIETIVGGGTVDVATESPPFSGAATDARFIFESPVQIAIDAAGNLYLADEPGHRIWKVDPDGVITTVAGTGEIGLGGERIQATDSELQSPYGLVVDDAGNLYIADQENAVIRVVDTDGMIRTLGAD